MHFQPAIAKSQSKQVEYVFSLSENHFQPASLESLTNQKSPIRSLVVIVPKLKSLFSSFENLRGIVRPLKLSEVKSLSKPKSLSMSKKRTVPQRFFNTNLSLFSFPTMPANESLRKNCIFSQFSCVFIVSGFHIFRLRDVIRSHSYFCFIFGSA